MERTGLGVSLKERQLSIDLQRRLGVKSIGDVMIRGRVRWHVHVERKGNGECVKACASLLCSA